MGENRGHQYQGEKAIKSDLSSMVGPIYNAGKATKHNFSGGYVAPKARADQQELVNKFFKHDKSEKVETIQSESVVKVESKMESKVEFSSGEERRKEALERRQEFLKENEDLYMQIKSSDFKMTNVKTRQQLEQERESFFQNTVMRVQEEAKMISSRAKEDEMKRIEYLKSEEERIKREEILRQEAMLRAEEERKRKEFERQEELKKQQLAFAKQRLLKKQQEEGERMRLERIRLEEERKRAIVQKSEVSERFEENSRIEELRRQDELKRLEKQRLEQMIIQESKVIAGQVAKRSDDVSGLGWGNVKTGFVSKKKLGFLQREISMERDSNDGSPVPNGRGRGLRVTFADSPNGSRPGSTLGWTEHVADIDVRSQTPPLAGEWAAPSKQMSTNQGTSFLSQKSFSVQSHQSQSQTASFQSSQSSTFSSVQKSSFSSSQSSSFKTSSTQASNFEAFPGLGRIENLKIE